jgi:hypothetical protein
VLTPTLQYAAAVFALCTAGAFVCVVVRATFAGRFPTMLNLLEWVSVGAMLGAAVAVAWAMARSMGL